MLNSITIYKPRREVTFVWTRIDWTRATHNAWSGKPLSTGGWWYPIEPCPNGGYPTATTTNIIHFVINY